MSFKNALYTYIAIYAFKVKWQNTARHCENDSLKFEYPEIENAQ